MTSPVFTEQERKMILKGLLLLKRLGKKRFQPGISFTGQAYGPHLGIEWVELGDCVKLFQGEQPISWRIEKHQLFIVNCAVMQLQMWLLKETKKGNVFAELSTPAANRLYGKVLYVQGFRFEYTVNLLGPEGMQEAEQLQQQLTAA